MTAAEALEHPWLSANAAAPAGEVEAWAAGGGGQLPPNICASLHAFKVRSSPFVPSLRYTLWYVFTA